MFSPDPRDGLDVNINGFTNVLEAARKYEIPVVYASTSSLYSKCWPPHSESQEVVPGSFYELSMFTREKIAELYTELYGMNLVGLRYFSVYGPHEQHKGKYANNISQFLWEMANGRSPVIYGDGSQTRDFTFVDDIVEANILAMRSKLKGEILNVGTGVSHSFNDIVEKLNGVMGTAITPTYVPNPLKSYVMHTQADTVKAERLLGFRAKTSLNEGIKRTVKYYSSLKK
jgi:UDP-glucose 4-epimerase